MSLDRFCVELAACRGAALRYEDGIRFRSQRTVRLASVCGDVEISLFEPEVQTGFSKMVPARTSNPTFVAQSGLLEQSV